ncbi:MAG TPA: antitoxin [Desulfobacterales bacterium]|nr:antitoxin [Desulfobacterales bacterium]
MVDFTKEEKAFLESYERDEWQSVKNKKSEISRYQQIAKGTFKKDSRINIRMSSKDIHAMQLRALEEGIPYQTLITSVLHKYVSGRLGEKQP